MIFTSVEFVEITIDRLKNNLTSELSEKRLKMNYVRSILRN
jgi:hypothetical protein